MSRFPDASFDLAFSEYGASIWCDPYKWLPEAFRLLRPGGRLVFLRNSIIVMLCALEDEEATSETLQRPQRGMHRIEWPDDDGVNFYLGHGDLFGLLRDTGFQRREPPRAVRAGGRKDPRVLLVRHGRLGPKVAGGGDLGGAQARLTLASTSPQRRAILEQLRIPFEIVAPAYVEDDPPDADATELVLRHAVGKARSVHAGAGLTLGVDTTVLLDGRIYGKAADRDDARRMLQLLTGRTHTVVSGVCLLGGDEEVLAHEMTDVTFRLLSNDVVDAYLESGEWEGRAGAYAIQGLGGRLVERIEGDYLNVVGLPGALLVSILEVHAPNLLQTRR